MSALTPGKSPLPANIARIFIAGFMGAGKTTVGRLLAERLEWDFADSDLLLEAQTGHSIASIFEIQGELMFREMEADIIRANVTRNRLVLALGGGALERTQTRELLVSLPDSLLIFLDAPLHVLVSRCSGQANGPVRPVLADRARLQERWTARLSGYREAHLTVSTEGCMPGEVADRVFQELANRCRGIAAPGSEPQCGTGVSA